MKLNKRNLFYRIVVLLIFLYPLLMSYGQRIYSLSPFGLSSYFNKVYKLDQNLVNGVKYYIAHSDATGDPFLTSDNSTRGRIIVNNQTYNDVLLKYDICDQHVILEYNYTHGGMNLVILNNESISEFEIYQKVFRKYNFPQTGERFFQVIPSDSMAFLLSWKKELIPSGSFTQKAFEYTREKRKFYLLLHNNLILLKGNSSFAKALPDYIPEIRKYMKQNKIKLRKSDDGQLADLINFCGKIYFNSKPNPGK